MPPHVPNRPQYRIHRALLLRQPRQDRRRLRPSNPRLQRRARHARQYLLDIPFRAVEEDAVCEGDGERLGPGLEAPDQRSSVRDAGTGDFDLDDGVGAEDVEAGAGAHEEGGRGWSRL